jgi:glycosyltransferase involved in cell wall biosynthesis
VGDAYLWVGELTPYKRGDIAVEAFNQMGLPLRMIGKGPLSRRVRAGAEPNITFQDKLSFADLKRAYATCKALVFTAEEDFGIIPVEAMASGRPVIAFGKGGVRDTVQPNVTGIFYEEQTVASLIEGVRQFEVWQHSFSPECAVAQARNFSGTAFDRKYISAVRGFAAKAPQVRDRLDEILGRMTGCA